MTSACVALVALAALGANLYPDPRLPPLATNDNERQLSGRVSQLERALEKSRGELASFRGRKTSSNRVGDTVNLRLSLALWTLLGIFSVMRMRVGKAVPAGLTLLMAFVGGSFALISLLQTLVDTLKRTLGLGPPKLRCYKCFTIFEVPSSSVGVAACPNCGTANQVVSRARGAFG